MAEKSDCGIWRDFFRLKKLMKHGTETQQTSHDSSHSDQLMAGLTGKAPQGTLAPIPKLKHSKH